MIRNKCKTCPAFYHCTEDNLRPVTKGYRTEMVDGKPVRLCVLETTAVGRHLTRYAYYCLATPQAKKIANQADWAGHCPKWCPLRQEE